MEIYFDNAATTKVDKRVIESMIPYFTEEYGNSSSQHSFGQKAHDALENSRQIIADSIGAKKQEIYFNSGGTESNNHALKGLFFANPDKKHIITTKIEHDSILETCKWLEKHGAKITYLNVDKDGYINLDELEKEIKKDTLVVSIIHGNNEIGTIQNIEKIGQICKKNKVYFHIDACQSYMKVPINADKDNLDLISLNAHKIHGPKGVGALYIRKGVKIDSLLNGGGHEGKLRSGTVNVSGIVGFAKAVEISDKKDLENISGLRDKIIKGLLDIENVSLNGPKERLCNNINVSFKNIEGEAILGYLDSIGIAVSTGSACSSNTLKSSHVLKAIGKGPLEANSSIRISLSKYNTLEEVDYFLREISKIVDKLRKMSPIELNKD